MRPAQSRFGRIARTLRSRRIVAAVLACLNISLASDTAAQDVVDPGLMASGGALFEQNCALCHGGDGAGQPPHFPALAANSAVVDLTLIVTNIHQGLGNMPPFPDLDAEEIAALASFVRNSWGNDMGGVSADEVALLIEGLDRGGPARSIWDGVYSTAQAARGRLVYEGQCAVCHGRRLNGAAEDPDMQSGPPLARSKFLRSWEERSLAVLLDYTRATMPQANPGSLSDGQYADIIAYMLSVSDAQAGTGELGTDLDALARIAITQKE